MMEISVRTLGKVGLFKVEGPVRDGAHLHLRNAELRRLGYHFRRVIQKAPLGGEQKQQQTDVSTDNPANDTRHTANSSGDGRRFRLGPKGCPQSKAIDRDAA